MNDFKTVMAIKTEVKNGVDNKRIGSIYLYDDIAPNNRDMWSGRAVESETSAQSIQKQIEEMGDIAELNVYIASNGGDVRTGLAIYSQLKRLECPKTAYIDGVAASIATVIPCACDKIVMYKTGIFMIHNASCGCYGNAEDMRKTAEILETYSESIRQAYVNRCKIPEDEIKALMDAESFMTANQALEYGFIDEITDKPAVSASVDEQSKKNPKNFFGMSAILEMARTINYAFRNSGAEEIKPAEFSEPSGAAESEDKANEDEKGAEENRNGETLRNFLKAFMT